jgi:hypothetical protein
MGAASGSDSSSSNENFIDPNQQPFLQGLYQAGADQLQNFQPNQQIAQGALGGFQQGLGAGSQPNPYLQQQLGVFQDQLGLANQASGGQAGLGGGFGGGRQGVAEHLNAQSFQQNVGNFLGNQFQADQNRNSQERQNALGQAGSVLGVQPFQQQGQAINQFAGQIGGPTILGEGSSSGSSFKAGVGAK